MPWLEAVLVGALCGLVGVQVVLRRQAFFTMAMTHATFPGVVVAAVTGLNLYLGGFAAGVVAAVAVTALSRRRGHDPSTATAVALAAGFALGAALMAAQDGFSRDLTAYLTGSILTVGRADLLVAGGVTAAVALVLAVLHKELVLTAFDPAGARAAGYRVAALDLLVLVLIEAVVATAVPAVGTILTLALVVAPAGAARLWTDRFAAMTAVAVPVAVGSAAGGLLLSRTLDIAAGGAISLLAAACFVLSALAGSRSPLRRALRGESAWARRRNPDGPPRRLVVVRLGTKGPTAGLLIAAVVVLLGATARDSAPVRLAASPPVVSATPAAAAAPSTPAPSLPPSPSPVFHPGTGPSGSFLLTGTQSVALTFDDGPDPINTPRLLALLRERHIHATFCMVGFRVRDRPDLVRQIYADGHTLCNHSWQHLLNLAQRDDAYVDWDLKHTNDMIHAAVGADAPIRYFRAPGGNFTPALVAKAQALGMDSIYWDVDPRDWEHTHDSGASAHIDRVIGAVQHNTRPGSIVLSHDNGQPNTITAYQHLLPWLQERFALDGLPAAGL